MKLITYLTPSHEELYENYFLPTIPTDIELTTIRGRQLCNDGRYPEKKSVISSGWKDQVKDKLSQIIDLVESYEAGELFVVSDVDVQFFGSIAKPIEELMLGKEICFQRDEPHGTKQHCTGFYAAKKSFVLLKMLKKAVEMIERVGYEQKAVNHALRLSELRSGFLDTRFYTHGLYQGEWDGCFQIIVPETILVHHANWTRGIQNKIKLLDTVKKIMGPRRRNEPEELRRRGY